MQMMKRLITPFAAAALALTVTSCGGNAGGDAPTLSTVYKLVEDEGGPKMKLSTGKATLPGRKQVFRVLDNGKLGHDVVALAAILRQALQLQLPPAKCLADRAGGEDRCLHPLRRDRDVGESE